MTPPPGAEPARSLPGRFWNRLNTQQRQTLRTLGEIRRIAPGSSPVLRVAMEAPLTIAVSGWAKSVTRMPEHDDIMLRVHGAGDLIGDLPMLPALAGHERLIALTGMEVLTVPAAETAGLFATDPDLHRVVGEVLIERLAEADRRSATTAGRESTQRIAWLLVELAMRHGESNGQGVRIPVPLTQDELGQLVGTSRESVARALTFLGRKGFVLHKRKSYTVVDLEGLADYGQWSEPPSGLRPVRDPVAFEFAMAGTGKKKPPVIEEVSGFWTSLRDRQQGALVGMGRILQFKPGDDLCRQGDSAENILVIREGWAKVCVRNQEGHEIVVAVRGAGELVGEIGAISGGVRSATVVALRAVTALSIPASRFRYFLHEHTEVWSKVLETMNLRLEQTTRRIVESSAHDGETRLARFVLGLVEGAPAGDGGAEIPALSQAELASCVDVSKETVSRVFKDWRQQGVVETGRRRTVVLDVGRLREHASPPAAR